jgi:hypothetical protein
VIAHPFNGDNLHGRVGPEVFTKLGNVHIQVSGIEERIVAPQGLIIMMVFPFLVLFSFVKLWITLTLTEANYLTPRF